MFKDYIDEFIHTSWGKGLGPRTHLKGGFYAKPFGEWLLDTKISHGRGFFFGFLLRLFDLSRLLPQSRKLKPQPKECMYVFNKIVSIHPNNPSFYKLYTFYTKGIPRHRGGWSMFLTPPTLTEDFRKIDRGLFWKKARRRRKIFGVPFFKKFDGFWKKNSKN